MWTDGYTGERIEEPANPGQADAARNGQNKRAIPKETKNEHIWLKSQNVGSCEETNEEMLNADMDIYALQESKADIKTYLMQKRTLHKAD